ncbi:2OG-Fe(II) oxygenase [Methylomarinum sp. Ch1-1]|uniref:2OG-Fe(II) oxygenase n=1 Tax=Methylomarinum roseum TaxID=3067653 RepID=A0AAU7NW73_9GAMM|nr:2OG-Fe(II) oxygenase [Methylomarinum sp. Ch1-1]MDP4522707.1 2OG-Fe(II) oxygenase [Methylomarinum sp. Ch1-1]
MKPLLDILEQINKPGSFCAIDEMQPCFPGLEIEHVGTIGLPLIDEQARQIIAQASQAPYGLGDKTLVDTDIRRVWELQPEQFRLTNPDWDLRLSETIESIRKTLGVGKGEIICDPYKLLLYEAGSFFVPHRDTEKIENMFATLIVTLPSRHQGGELIVSHAGEEKCFASGGDGSEYYIRYAAFYADCQHEVKPLTDGYRLCLVYNLALANVKEQPVAAEYSAVTRQLKEYLKSWKQREDSEKLAILLEHQYTQAGISMSNLKNLDRTQAQVLIQAAEQAGCKAYLALLTLWESGDAEEIYYGDYHRYGYNYDDEDEEFEIGEIFDSSLTVDHWQDSTGIIHDFGEMSIAEEQIVSRRPLREGRPDQQEVEGPTGNAGATIDRWYRRAAIVLWPEQRHLRILTQFGERSSVYRLQDMLQNGADPSLCREFAAEIILHWKDSSPYHWSRSDSDSELHNSFLAALLQLQDQTLLQNFLDRILCQNFAGGEGRLLAENLRYYGWQCAERALETMSHQQQNANIVACIKILDVLADNAVFPSDNEERQRLCRTAAQNCLSNWRKLIESDELRRNDWRGQNEALQRAAITGLFRVCHRLQMDEALQTLADWLTQQTQVLSLRGVLLPCLHDLNDWFSEQNRANPAFATLLATCLQQIKALADVIIEEPKDWRQSHLLSCQCKDCQTINQFVRDPKAQEYRMCANQNIRSHIESNIRTERLDIDCATDKKGRPYTLICTKNRASYHRALRQKACDTEAWQRLAALS